MTDYNGLREALEYVVKNTRPPLATKTIDGAVYANEAMHKIADEEPPEFHYEPLSVSTLTGFVDYIKANRDGLHLNKTFVTLSGPASMRLISTPAYITANDPENLVRECFIKAVAELPQVPFGQFRDVEAFIVMLQTCFADSPDRETLLKYIGNIEESETVSAVDDGISQKIVARTGIASVETVVLPNPVKLRPYRTFQELEQPESEFVLRVRKGGQVALFEADGGAWKVKCRALIKAALSDALKDVEGVCIIS